jgi:hypothetical protein
VVEGHHLPAVLTDRGDLARILDDLAVARDDQPSPGCDDRYPVLIEHVRGGDRAGRALALLD